MPDKEKVDKAIEYLEWYFTSDDGAADENAVEAWDVLLTLLLREELKPEQAILRGTTWFCPRCKNPIDMFNAGEQNSYCPYCGKGVKWDD